MIVWVSSSLVKDLGAMMLDQKNKVDRKKVDTKEFDLPETHFVRDIENKVFQGIVLECLAKIEGIALIEGNLLDSILGRGSVEGVKGIYTEQDGRNHTINVKLEINIQYGLSIPDIAEEIQSKITEDITKYTGLHVNSVHVVFKNIISNDPNKKALRAFAARSQAPLQTEGNLDDEYNDEF